MPESSLPIDKILTLLAAAPPRLAASTAGLKPTQLQTAPKEGDWSAIEVLAHMRACADVWGNAIATILAQDTPTLRAVNPRTWIQDTDYPKQKFQSSLRAFTAQRTELLAVLEALSPKDWSRKVTVTGAGAALERSVLFYAQWLATHERAHVKQIERIAKEMRG